VINSELRIANAEFLLEKKEKEGVGRKFLVFYLFPLGV
jgi:hypothetical protein